LNILVYSVSIVIITFTFTKMDSRISNYFLTSGLATPGISYEVTDGKLTIVIDPKRVSISLGSSVFNIGNDCFWVKEKRELENSVEYTVSHIVQHGPNVSFDKCQSKKVSDVFPGISYAETITVILK
jgi:hypothetical protein